MDNLKVLNFEQDDFQKSLDAMRRQLPQLIEHVRLVAELRKAAYEAHIAQGFTPDQALDLCKKLTM